MSAVDPLQNRDAVFFDAGFTLLMPVAPIPHIYLEHASEVGVTPCRDAFGEAFHATWKGIGGRVFRPDHRTSDVEERDAWHVLTQTIAKHFPDLHARHPEWFDLLMNRFDAPTTWVIADGAVELLRALRNRGLKLAIVSNWHSALVPILREHGLLDYFDAVLCSGSEGYRKPHPELFRRALSRVRTSPERAVHVGDSHHDDVVGARRARIAAWHLSETTEAGRHGTARNLRDLAVAWRL